MAKWLAASMIIVLSAGVLAAAAEKPAVLPPGTPTVQISSPMVPPEWAVKERLLLVENARAVEKFYARYYDDRGYLKCQPRWSIGDGVDDSPENIGNWPLLYALGADPVVLELHNKAWDAHVKQFSEKNVEFTPKQGNIYKEFITSFDAFHAGEHYSSFIQMPVADPRNRKFMDRVLRFAGFYLNEGLKKGDEPNYDPNLKIIRSVMHGSRGATLEIEPSYWGNKWEEVAKWERMARWTNVKGDDIENLYMTTFAANAFIVGGQEKYKNWMTEYVDAWTKRADENSGIFPCTVGLTGKVGEQWENRWWARFDGTWRLYGGIRVGLENALMLTGDSAKYMEPLRRQLKVLIDHPVDDKGKMFPAGSYDGKTWGGKARFGRHAIRLYLSEFRDDDLKIIDDEVARCNEPGKFSYDPGFFYHIDDYAWLYFVLGKNPEFPQKMLDSDLKRVQSQSAAMAQDKTEDWKRRSDDSHRYIPPATHSLVNLACGGIGPLWKEGTLIFSEVWHYDPVRNRPGLPEDVAALIDSIKKDEVSITLVNLCQTQPRTLVVRTGAYGEHQCLQVVPAGAKPVDVNRNWFAVDLAPGCGGKLVLKVKRFANQPKAGMPWE